jgi:hypothetical protein
MKYLKVVGLALMVLLFSGYRKELPTMLKLKCSLHSEKTYYKIGEVPKLRVQIQNASRKDVYLIGSLDGSIARWRMPYCYFTIEKPKPDTIRLDLCGNLNTLKPKNIRLVKSGAGFNPYSDGFFPNYTGQDVREFRNPGIYRLRFHYSTNSENIDDFMGNGPLDHERTDAAELRRLLKQVPKVSLESNEIELIFEN